ncbi:hypothetical protein [Bradyrhizobium sp. CCGUVB23]|uniref:hypothetical protein n=1 Tax=Bradyrhizobium sp. CCGUVB23 TaxID=2949630 RepID=UPI0020B2793B|nr:hypothetical protein [Bradyrhizobium sp. CCGUVB23]MCP3460433.1 hypothetical protein [Bradyrhizobium sp. CCGUVB23]
MELKAIDRTDRGVRRLNAALSIYRETILAEAQNPERQILYWIDHSRETLADEFRCFAIQNEGEVIGYLQYSYFREEHIFFFEYLCLRDQTRSGLLPSEAVESIRDHLAQNYRPEFSIVFEVARKRTDLEEWSADKKLISYFRRLGFRTVDFNYRYPVLQSYDGAISYPADLMVSLPSGRRDLSAFELRTILRCVYFKHYLRWDRPFLDEESFRKRELLINELYSSEVSKISGDDTFGTYGDDRRSLLTRIAKRQPQITALLGKIFGPKMPRVLVVMLVMLAAQSFLGSSWMLVPFVLAVAAVYCLGEDTDTSRRLLLVIISRMSLSRQRS